MKSPFDRPWPPGPEPLNPTNQRSLQSPEVGCNLRTVNDILKAAHFAAEKHAGQRRKGAAAEPYINHLLEVAELASGAIPEPDTNLVIAALLHDTIEDAGVTKEQLLQVFGSDVADVVLEVTDDKTLPSGTEAPANRQCASQICPSTSHQIGG